MKALDLTGQRFGKLVALERAENDAGGHAQWRCACDCGNECVATASTLRAKRGGKRSCGCMAFHDLTGQRFGLLIVIKRTMSLNDKVAWLCRCDCGQYTTSTTSNLLRGASASCGCVRTKHHGKGTRLYRIWTGIKDRCLNPASKYRSRYGGRGISVCEEWRDFKNFQEWAMANGYASDLEVDRINNDGDYCPDNCRWITKRENASKGNRTIKETANVASAPAGV